MESAGDDGAASQVMLQKSQMRKTQAESQLTTVMHALKLWKLRDQASPICTTKISIVRDKASARARAIPGTCNGHHRF